MLFPPQIANFEALGNSETLGKRTRGRLNNRRQSFSIQDLDCRDLETSKNSTQ